MVAAVAMGVVIPLSLKRAGVLGGGVEVKSSLPNDVEVKPETSIEREVAPVVSAPVSPPVGSKPPDVYPTIQAKPADASPEKPLYVKGTAWLGKKLRVLLSDGRTLSEADGVVVRADSTGVTLKDGTRIWSEQIKSKEAPVVSVPGAKEPEKLEIDVGVAGPVQTVANATETALPVNQYIPIPRTARSGNGGPRSGPRSAPPSLVRGADNVTSNAR